jgi:hypothetical protein
MAFKIDGTTLTTQPSRIEITFPSSEVLSTADGSPIVVEIPAGSKRRIRVTWGVEGTKTSLITQLELLRTSAIVSVTYDDDESNEVTVTNTYMPRVPLDTPPGSLNALVPYQNPIILEFIEL